MSEDKGGEGSSGKNPPLPPRRNPFITKIKPIEVKILEPPENGGFTIKKGKAEGQSVESEADLSKVLERLEAIETLLDQLCRRLDAPR